MQKSIIERVFPKSKQPLLPQHGRPASSSHYRDDESELQASSPARNEFRSNASTTLSSARKSSGSKSSLEDISQTLVRPAPLSASAIHHDDPFIAVDRAATTLQETIQSLLDFQSRALSDRTSNDQDDTASQRSGTPTQSTVSGTITTTAKSRPSGVIPVRQPAKKKLTLRAARNGIGRSMHECAALKDEELRITELERLNRQAGLDKLSVFRTQQEAVDHEISTLRTTADNEPSRALRAETEAVEGEIKELEDRLMELKARHRHLLERKSQQDNASASQLSSYQGTKTAIDREIRQFLRNPPVSRSLAPRNLSIPHRDAAAGQDFYALHPKRRTLEIASEQWTREIDILANHKVDVENEKDALLKGAKVWKETITRIDEFERVLRETLRGREHSTVPPILPLLDSTLVSLQEALHKAEIHDWKLLVCAVGAELEAFKEARLLLAPEEPLPILEFDYLGQANSYEDDDVPYADFLEETASGIKDEKLRSPDNSNESLKATLREFPAEDMPLRNMSGSRRLQTNHGATNGSTTRPLVGKDESEDDEPGPDFLLSHDA